MPFRIKVGGKFNFKSLPIELQDRLKVQIKTNEPKSFKINGKPVTHELIKELEIQAKQKKEIVINEVREVMQGTEEERNNYVDKVKVKKPKVNLAEEFKVVKKEGFLILRKWAKEKLGVTDRSEHALIKEIKIALKGRGR